MSEDDPFDDLSDAHGLPPRRETFLARYSRNSKLLVTTLILAITVLPPAWIHGRAHHRAESALSESTNIDDADGKSSAPAVASDVAAAALNDQDDRSVKLNPAPDPLVSQDDADGSLPRMSESGLRPWQVYARPFNSADKRPRIAIIVTGMGLARALSDQTIAQLPPTITLALAPQSPVIGAWSTRARQDGHEVLMQVPAEPFDYPRSDPGPDTLLTTLPNSDNIARLLKIMRRASGYVGLICVEGSHFTTDSAKLMSVLQVAHDRGLLMVDARAAPHSAVTELSHNIGLPVATVTQRIDGDLNPDVIAATLADLEKIARVNGRAIGITAATPVMLSQLQIWAKTLPQHGIALAPVSAMIQ